MCYGARKIELTRRIAERQGFTLDEATFYSDSATDLPLREAVETPLAVNPATHLRRIACARDWRIERW